ncbi:MAG: hypothetical protein K8R44_05705 [Sulfurimonas sp.]|nr:hypothetical protein [Sulfurimonas sp.]
MQYNQNKLEAYSINKQVPESLLIELKKESGDRTFFNRSDLGLEVFIVMKNISKHELKEFKNSLSVIYQDYDIPFLILKYEKMSFDIPLFPNLNVDNFTNSLNIYIIDSQGYTLKHMRNLGLEHSLAKAVLVGIGSISTLSKEEISADIFNKIYPFYTINDMLKGGMRQRFER